MSKRILFCDEDDNWPEPSISKTIMMIYKITKSEWDQMMIEFNEEIPQAFSNPDEAARFLESWRKR